MIKTPVHITPSPIIEANVEWRFQPVIPKETILGVLYEKVKNEFTKLEKFPSAFLPPEILENDPTLQYAPMYRLIESNFTIQVGYHSISFHLNNKYSGWQFFEKKLFNFFQTLKETSIFQKPTSFSMRYINFFEYEVYPNLNLNVLLNGEEPRLDNLILRMELAEHNFLKVLQFANKASIIQNQVQKEGSLVDITCIYSNDDYLQSFENLANQAHQLIKNTFFSLLKEDFIERFNPRYI